jgi:3-oxoadipate enol-lactonase
VPRTRCGDIDLAWYEVGRGAPTVLVHGLADDHRAWRRVLPALSLSNRVILYDLRGHGQTAAGEPNGTLEQLSADLVALMDALELERANLVGFSLGGTIVMRTAIDHPNRVDHLIPVATSSRVGRSAAEWYSKRAEMARSDSLELRSTLEQDTRDVYFNKPDEFGAGWLIRSQSTADPTGFGNACVAMAALNERPLDPELGHIQAPTLVIAGDRDQHCPPRAAEIIQAGIRGSRLEVLSEVGHPIPAEKPAELSSRILEFLAG